MPEMAEEKVDKILKTIDNLPGYVFELSANLGSERNFSIRGNFPIGASLEVMNAEMDKLVRVSDRQLSKACIASLEEDIAKHEQQLENAKSNLKLVQSKFKKYQELPATGAAEIDNAGSNVKALEAMIERKKKFLEKTRKDAE